MHKIKHIQNKIKIIPVYFNLVSIHNYKTMINVLS